MKMKTRAIILFLLFCFSCTSFSCINTISNESEGKRIRFVFPRLLTLSCGLLLVDADLCEKNKERQNGIRRIPIVSPLPCNKHANNVLYKKDWRLE